MVLTGVNISLCLSLSLPLSLCTIDMLNISDHTGVTLYMKYLYIYSGIGHLAVNWYWTIGPEMKKREMNDIEIHVNSIISS